MDSLRAGRVSLDPGISNARDCWMSGHRASQSCGILALPLEPKPKGLYMSTQPIGIVRTQYVSDVLSVQHRRLPNVRTIAARDARGQVAVSSQVFRRAVDDYISSVVQRPPKAWSSEGVVHDHGYLPLLCHLDDTFPVRNDQQRIRNRLEVQQGWVQLVE